MSRHDSRAWRLMEALDNAPFGNEERLEIIQGFLDEERTEALYVSPGKEEQAITMTEPILGPTETFRINRRSATEGF